MLVFRGVTFHYDGAPRAALANVDLTVAAGERIAIVGPTGAGKTTLARLALGLLRPTSGRVEVGGLDTANAPMSRLTELGGLVLQDPGHQLFTERVDSEIAFGLRGVADAPARVAAALDRFGLSALRDRHPLCLSEGERRRVALAATLARRPALVVLDEPTLGQDERQRSALAALVIELAAAGVAVVAMSHDPEFVNDACARVIVLREGRIVADLPIGNDAAAAATLVAAGVPLADIPATTVRLAERGRAVRARTVEAFVVAVRG